MINYSIYKSSSGSNFCHFLNNVHLLDALFLGMSTISPYNGKKYVKFSLLGCDWWFFLFISNSF